MHEKKPAGNNALAKNGAGPANIGCSSLSALVWGWTSSISVFVNVVIFVLNLSSLAGMTSNEFPVLRQCKKLAGI